MLADRLPPVNVEAEEAILGGILLDPFAINRVAELNPEAFSISFHKKIFKACKALFNQNQPVDLMTVSTWLSDRKQLDAVGGPAMLAQLVNRAVSAVNIDQYVALVSEKFYRRILRELGEQIYERSHQTAINTSSIIKWAIEKIEELPSLSQEEELDTHKYNKCISEVRAIELTVTDPGLKSWKLKKLAAKYDCSPRQLEEIYYRSLLAEDDEPMMTWEEAIAKHGSAIREWRMHGWLPKGKLIIEHGDGGAGKTRLSYNFLYHVATGQDWEGFPVKQGNCIVIQTDEAPSDMLQVLEDRGLANHPAIRYKTRWNIDFLQGLIQEIEEFKPAFILIDSLTSINKRSIFSENDVEYARPLLLLKDVAQKYGITIIVIHHSSREGNARGSTAIRNSASEVWKLKVDNSKSMDGSHRVLEIEKSRSRKLASYLLRYNEDDGSWACLGKTSSDNNEGGIGGPIKERIVKFLRQSPGVFYHPEEIQNEIGGGIDSVRRSSSDLANEGIISRKGRRPSLYGINFGGGDEPDAPPTEPSGLSTLRPSDTTDQSVQAMISPRSLARSFSESNSNEPSSDFRSSDRENSVFLASADGEKNMRSLDRLIGRNNCDEAESLESNNNKASSNSLSKPELGLDTTDQSVQKCDRFVENGLNVAQLNNSIHETVDSSATPEVAVAVDESSSVALKKAELTADDIQDFVDMIRFAINNPETAEPVQQTLKAFFSEYPQEKKEIWKALTKHERNSFKALTAKPEDFVGQQLKVGLRVTEIGNSEFDGEITALKPQYRGSPKNRFIQWVVTVKWDDGTISNHPAEWLEIVEIEPLKTESNATDPVDIKAITLHQPWASLVGKHKHYETRSWSTNYRGKIAIHATKLSPSCSAELLELAGEDLPLGAVIAIADLTDCILMTEEFILQQSETELKCGDWKPGRFAWKLENVRFLETPILAKGQQGLWNWKPMKDEEPTSKRWRPQVGERCQSTSGSPLTVKEDRGHSFVIIYDNDTVEATLYLEHLQPLPLEKDPKVIAPKLFETIKPGDELKALKHPSHKGFARRRGKVIEKTQINGKFLVKCETKNGVEVFNLEAVEVL